MVLKYSEYQKKKKNYNLRKMDTWMEVFKNWRFYLSILSIYFIVCGEQKTFMYKEMRSP